MAEKPRRVLRTLRQEWRKLKSDLGQAAVAVAIVVLSPLWIPLGCIVTEMERKHIRATAEHTPCAGCNELLGAAGIDAAQREFQVARERACREALGFVNWRRFPDVICTNCGKRYTFSKDKNRLTEVAA